MRQAKDTEEQGEPAPQARKLQMHAPLCMSSWDHPHFGPVRDVRWLTGVKITKEGARPCLVRPDCGGRTCCIRLAVTCHSLVIPLVSKETRNFADGAVRACITAGVTHVNDSWKCDAHADAGLRRQYSNTNSLPCKFGRRWACSILGLQLRAHI